MLGTLTEETTVNGPLSKNDTLTRKFKSVNLYIYGLSGLAILRWQYTHFSSLNHGKDDVFEIALQFRLLRQEGYCVAADVFECFNDKGKGFDMRQKENIKGMMELYEASQMRIEGEDILDEAKCFSSKCLNALLTCDLDHNQARMIESTLQYPYRKSFERLLSPQRFVNDMPGVNPWMEDLLEVANTERRIVQTMHQKEIHQINALFTVGPNSLFPHAFPTFQMKFARDQPPKWYMWSMAFLPDPSLFELRIELIKPISLVYIIDDIFDVHGIVDEIPIVKLHPFCPLSLSLSLSHTLTHKSWRDQECDYHFGAPLVLAHLFFLMGQNIANQSMDSEKEEVQLPNTIFLVAEILRLWDDLGCAQDENQEGYDGSYVECYLRENQGSSYQSAREHVMELISKLWKLLNKECLSPCPFSAPFLEACVNAAKMVSLMYNYEDKHGLGLLQDYMKSFSCDHETL
ncbi:hypothetical protein BT93_L1488 [Corymbia citriodora subsp. variegata]|uniref:Uncharacterized protein n=1 Tax=Corymbia citriodora subsp. variegata TaxID=360336 RepID=A0A8T0CML7_CORYI|nr:hypothetical protein BT93_L1488 [Corymbia citriodora subsp. variegata]